MTRTAVFHLVVVALACGCATDRELASQQRRNPYTYPLASPGTEFGALPPAVQHTVRAEVGSAEISEAVKLYRDGIPFYKITFVNKELFPPLHVAADGSILNPDLSLAMGAPVDTSGIIRGGPVTGVNPNELPAAVSRSIRERAPNAVVDTVNRETWGDRLVYIVSFNDPQHHPRLYIAADGKVVNEGPK
jgi:hypothetical protein